MDTPGSATGTGHDNDEAYKSGETPLSGYNRRKSTPLPPLRRNSPFPPSAQPATTSTTPHKESSHGSSHTATSVTTRSLRTSQRRRKTAASSSIKHQLILTEDEHEESTSLETPTRRPRTATRGHHHHHHQQQQQTATATSPVMTRSTRRRVAAKQRNDADDIIARTPGAFPAEKAAASATAEQSRSLRPRAHSPRKKTRTSAEQHELLGSRRSTRARQQLAEEAASHKEELPAQLIRNGDTPWPSRMKPHTRPRHSGSTVSTGQPVCGVPMLMVQRVENKQQQAFG
ncbi:hypothetical protein SYNPS1DRAFT_31006 [Syncephalis pseudoplumigaleata]|uniref:Uncharacterized protein n=1 Tax=Syncephalis pseudoplumigaleata TaxID=1712513 RepID=A0A4P9YU06_9FUNG|nr:hypothetical protein SYNPS1DRAFT_31006 [Syncephalis pseudoplumigaleata]|eukprot:RKP23275.1 hypothetical protein SYNPS1DRAFT_31006 [Syncephalis pseudoplumigaleata]